jgi:hypothetical protein
MTPAELPMVVIFSFMAASGMVITYVIRSISRLQRVARCGAAALPPARENTDLA